METCLQTIADYGLRSLGTGERLLPSEGFTLCQQVTLIGSGMLWNLYFAIFALSIGFFLAVGLAMARESRVRPVRALANGFIFVFRGSPLFIQFFLAYQLLVLLPRGGIEIAGMTLPTSWLTQAWAGGLIVLTLNTSAYAAQIFHGALKTVPMGEIEAADAYGMSSWVRFRRVIWPTMLRLAWPSYTNEAIFLFHATTLVYFSAFPAWRQQGDALYYASYLADKTFNPFVAYPIVAGYFIIATLLLIWIFGRVNLRLNRHLPGQTGKLRYRPQLIR